MPESDSRDQNEEDRKPVEDPPVEDDRHTPNETERAGGEMEKALDSSTGTTTTSSSVLHNFTVFRDFFLAAFSDGYNVSGKHSSQWAKEQIQE